MAEKVTSLASQTQWYTHLRAQWPMTGRWASRLRSSLDYGTFLTYRIVTQLNKTWLTYRAGMHLLWTRASTNTLQWRRYTGRRQRHGSGTSRRSRGRTDRWDNAAHTGSRTSPAGTCRVPSRGHTNGRHTDSRAHTETRTCHPGTLHNKIQGHAQFSRSNTVTKHILAIWDPI